METALGIARTIHILFGVIALCSGIAAALGRKGGNIHRKAGQIYVVAMTGIFGTAVLLALHSGSFLLAVAIFSYCLTLAGFRSARNLRRKAVRPALIDILLTFATGVVGVGLMCLGVFSGNIPFMVFGGVCLFLAALDVRLFTNTKRMLLWLPRHIGYMGGAFISTVTAALVNNVYGLPPVIVWLLPTAIGTPLIVMAIRRYLPRRAVAALLLFLTGTIIATAQPYAEGGETRHRFAQMYLGADALYIPSGGDALIGGVQRTFSSVTSPRITIGGYHFWGHSDFAVNIPLASFSGGGLAAMLPEISVSALYFPWRVENGRLSPFAGISWMPFVFSAKQNNHTDAPSYLTHGSTVSTGLLLPFSFGRFELAAARLLNTGYDYPLPDGSVTRLYVPAWQFSFGFKYAFETTLSAEFFRESGREAIVEKQLADAGELNDAYLSVGLSSSFFLERSQYVKNSLSQLSLPVPVAILPEFAVGYYRHDLDAAAQISFRPHSHSQKGYGITQSWKRTSVTADMMKFVGDYHGFVPFAGVSCGWERVEYLENGSNLPRNNSDNGLTLGILAGWDIRPNRLQSFTIRTAVRWNFSRSISVAQPDDMDFGNLEINFFQLVLYPERMF